MTRDLHPRKSAAGRPRDESLTGTARARGRTVLDKPTTRGEQIVEMYRVGRQTGESRLPNRSYLDALNGFRSPLDAFRLDGEPLDAIDELMNALRGRYIKPRNYGQQDRPVAPEPGEKPFTPAELAKIRRGVDPTGIVAENAAAKAARRAERDAEEAERAAEMERYRASLAKP